METAWLEDFLAVLQEGGFLRAAAGRAVSQPGMTITCAGRLAAVAAWMPAVSERWESSKNPPCTIYWARLAGSIAGASSGIFFWREIPISSEAAKIQKWSSRGSGVVLQFRTGRHSTSRLHACVNSTSGNFEAAGTPYLGGDHPFICLDISYFEFLPTAFRQTIWAI